MDYPTIATYQNTDWNKYVGAVDQHLVETPFICEGGRDNECPVKYACPNDDNKFIGCPGENDKRVIWVFGVIWSCGGLDDNNVGEALGELLEGKEEDIWLWVDGDEDNLPEYPHGIRRLCNFQHHAVQALRRRQATPRQESRRDAEMRGRVQLEIWPVRMAAIAWLIISPKAMKKLNHNSGSFNSMKCDLEESVKAWFRRLDCWQIWNDVPLVSELFGRFRGNNGRVWPQLP